jgi:hypothetical protein
VFGHRSGDVWAAAAAGISVTAMATRTFRIDTLSIIVVPTAGPDARVDAAPAWY